MVVHDKDIICYVEPSGINVDRQDVLDAHKLEGPLKCGFDIELPARLVPGGAENLFVFAESPNGELRQLVRYKDHAKTLQLELTGRCNLRCPMCPSVSFSTFHNQDLSLEDLDIIQPLLSQIDSMCLDGFGEVLLAKRLEDYLAAIPWSKFVVFHTNGLLLDEKRSQIILKRRAAIATFQYLTGFIRP